MKTNRVGGGREEVSKHAKEAKEEDGEKRRKKRGERGLSLASTTGWLQVIHSAIIVRC